MMGYRTVCIVNMLEILTMQTNGDVCVQCVCSSLQVCMADNSWCLFVFVCYFVDTHVNTQKCPCCK